MSETNQVVESIPAINQTDAVTQELAEAYAKATEPTPKKRPTAAESLAKQRANDAAKKSTKPTKEPKVKASKKPAKKSPAKSDEMEPKKKAFRKVESNTKGGLKTGSTRMRLFKALAASDETIGMTAGEIKKATGMAENSGHLGVLLIEERNRGRVKSRVGYRGDNEKAVQVYYLSALGKKNFEDGMIDGNNWAGNRIGRKWTKERIKAENGEAIKKKSAKKGKKAVTASK